MAKEDWRLRGQDSYLKGVTLVHRYYRQYKKNPKWDHDHCDFCWKEFSLQDGSTSGQLGYTTQDEYYWICQDCFNDFKHQFCWLVIEADKATEPSGEH